MIERDTPERGPQSNADPRRSVNWTEFLDFSIWGKVLE
jgi:hypothetical protein